MDVTKELEIDLAENLKPGKKIHYMRYVKGFAEIRHIRAIVDEDMIVYRTWSREKKRWSYHVASRAGFELENRHGRLSL
jgi:hypothetical protein